MLRWLVDGGAAFHASGVNLRTVYHCLLRTNYFCRICSVLN
jgi:hypothetical protein